MAQDAGRVEGIGDGLRVGPGLELAADDRAGGQGLAVDLLQRDGVAFTVGTLRIVAAQGILTPLGVLAVHIHVLRGRDFRVAVGVGLDSGDGVGGDGRGGHPLVQQGVHERRVGAVLEQAAHQIGQQVLMPADGGIGADGDGAKGVMGGVVEGLAHAVQALEFDLHAPLGRHPVDGGQGVGIVGGELAVDVRRGLDHGLGADQIVEVGRGLGGEDRIVGAAEDLGALDLGVPIGALDQTDHQAAAGGLCQLCDTADHLGAALLIGLYGEAEAGPAAQFGLVGQPVEQLQRQGQPVRLFGVHGEVDVILRRDPGQPQDAGVELLPDAGLLRGLIAGRQGRQLDRDAVAGFRPLPFRRLADGGDGVGVDLFIAFGVMGGAGALAEHVERAEPALPVRPLQCRLDGPADHELLAHDADGGGDGLADDRLAQAADDSLEEAGQVGAGLLVHIHQLARQHQAPGRGVDEQAVGLAEVGRPVGRADLFGDQPVAGLFIRGAQQGLGQAHQGEALTGA